MLPQKALIYDDNALNLDFKKFQYNLILSTITKNKFRNAGLNDNIANIIDIFYRVRVPGVFKGRGQF